MNSKGCEVQKKHQELQLDSNKSKKSRIEVEVEEMNRKSKTWFLSKSEEAETGNQATIRNCLFPFQQTMKHC